MERKTYSLQRVFKPWFLKPNPPAADIELRTMSCDVANGVTNETPSLMDKYRNRIIIAVLVLVAFVQAFDATCICVSLPTIANELNTSVSESLSLGTSFLLAMTVAQPVIIESSYVLGRKAAYVICMIIFVTGTVICACSDSSTMLLVGRSIQGVGAGGPQPLGAMILVDLYPLRKRSRMVAYLTAPWALGTALGPVIGGLFTSSKTLGWQWIFWITVPILTIALVGAWVFFKHDPPSELISKLLIKFDWTGTMLFILSAVAFLWALIWGGSRYPWKSLYVLVPLGCSVVGFVMLGLYERSCAGKPMFPARVFNNRSTILQFVNTTIHGSLLWTALYFMSLYYLGVRGESPTATGVLALPATVTVAPMAMLVGFVAGTTGSYRWFLRFGWVLTLVVFGVMILIDRATEIWKLMIITLFLGISMGMLIPAMSVGIQSTIRKQDAPYALSMIYVFRAAGQCLGIAIGQGVFSGHLAAVLEDMGQSPKVVREIMKTIGHSAKTGLLVEPRLIAAVAESLRRIWIVSCGLAGVAVLLTIFIRCPRLPEDENRVREVEPTSESDCRLVDLESRPNCSPGYPSEPPEPYLKRKVDGCP